jgi:hypothetical protein
MPIGPVPVLNQFILLPDIPIEVLADVALCVPSEKELNSIEVPGLPSWGIAALAAALFAAAAFLLGGRMRRAEPV